MVGILGIEADVVLTELVLGHILEMVDVVLIEDKDAVLPLAGSRESDDSGEMVRITGLKGEPVAICIASMEGGADVTDQDVETFRTYMDEGILMKVDAYAGEFSFNRIAEKVERAKVIFTD